MRGRERCPMRQREAQWGREEEAQLRREEEVQWSKEKQMRHREAQGGREEEPQWGTERLNDAEIAWGPMRHRETQKCPKDEVCRKRPKEASFGFFPWPLWPLLAFFCMSLSASFGLIPSCLFWPLSTYLFLAPIGLHLHASFSTPLLASIYVPILASFSMPLSASFHLPSSFCLFMCASFRLFPSYLFWPHSFVPLLASFLHAHGKRQEGMRLKRGRKEWGQKRHTLMRPKEAGRNEAERNMQKEAKRDTQKEAKRGKWKEDWKRHVEGDWKRHTERGRKAY